MNKGQRTIAGLLSVIALLLVVNMVVTGTSEANAQNARMEESSIFVAGGATQIMNSGSSSPKWRHWRMTVGGRIDTTLIEFQSVGNCNIVDIWHQEDILDALD